MLSLEDAKRVYNKFSFENSDFIHSLGLTSTHIYGWWLHTIEKDSYLEIVDKKKWLLAKIKYGI